MNTVNNPYYLLDNTKACIPANEAGTGTIETVKNGIIGTGTSFKTELANGAWLVDLTNNEVRKVIQVESDTYAILDSPFTADIGAGTSLDYVPGWKTNRIREASIVIPVYQQDNTTENAWGVLITNSVEDFPPGLPRTVCKSSHDGGSPVAMIHPVIFDATDTQLAVTEFY